MLLRVGVFLQCSPGRLAPSRSYEVGFGLSDATQQLYPQEEFQVVEPGLTRYKYFSSSTTVAFFTSLITIQLVLASCTLQHSLRQSRTCPTRLRWSSLCPSTVRVHRARRLGLRSLTWEVGLRVYSLIIMR